MHFIEIVNENIPWLQNVPHGFNNLLILLVQKYKTDNILNLFKWIYIPEQS